MAKKQLPGLEDTPEVKAVREAADEYVKAKRAKARALAKMNDRKERLIELMQEHDVKSVKIDDGDKVLELDDTVKLKITKPKPAENDGDGTIFDEDDDDE